MIVHILLCLLIRWQPLSLTCGSFELGYSTRFPTQYWIYFDGIHIAYVLSDFVLITIPYENFVNGEILLIFECNCKSCFWYVCIWEDASNVKAYDGVKYIDIQELNCNKKKFFIKHHLRPITIREWLFDLLEVSCSSIEDGNHLVFFPKISYIFEKEITVSCRIKRLPMFDNDD